MRIFILVSVALAIVGCASTRVVPLGPDTYLIQRQGATGASSIASLKMDALEGAAAYCTERGKQFLTVSTSERGSVGIGQFPTAEIQFRCLASGDPAMNSPTLEPVPNTTIQVKH